MKMSDGERLIAVMLADIMEAMKLNNTVDPALIRNLIGDNDEWAIKRKYNGIFNNVPPSDVDVQETSDILWMWSIVEGNIAKLTGRDAVEAGGWHYNQWRGFDGNNDPHYGIAHTLIVELGEFASSRAGVNLNSHTRTSLPRYQQMLVKFNSYVQAGNASPLDMAALRDLCS